MTELSDYVFKYLKNYLQEKNEYTPVVSTLSKGTKFPLVVFDIADDKESDRSTHRIDSFSSIVYEIDIYAKAKDNISERTIARSIEKDIKHVMGKVLGLRRILDKPTPDVDVSVYRITLRYAGTIYDQRDCFV